MGSTVQAITGSNSNPYILTKKLNALSDSAKRGNVEWQALLKNEDKVTSVIGEHNFEIYLELAAIGRGNAPTF